MSSSSIPNQVVDSDQIPCPPAADTPADSTKTTNDAEISTVRMALRLALGSVVLGTDELKRRFEQRQSQIGKYYIPQATVNPDESPNDRLRYAVEGALVESIESMDRGIKLVGIASNRVFNLASRLASPVTGSRFIHPIRQQIDRLEARGEQVTQTWINNGRTEEYLSRALVQDTTREAIEETLDYLAISPEMDQLIEQQTSEMASDVVEEIQERTTGIFGLREWFKRIRSR